MAGLKTFLCGVALGLLLLPATSGHADSLVCTNGERFVGTILEETGTNVVFESELAGRLVFPRAKIRDLLRGAILPSTNATPVVSTASNSVVNLLTNPMAWKPPGVGKDGSDWVQLKSGEWLRGELKYIQNKQVEFDSDEMDQQTLKLKDVSQLFTAHRVFTKFEDREPVYGRVVISNDVVKVNGAEPLSLHRDLLMGVTPSGGRTGINNWSGSATVGLSLQSGNNDQTTVNSSAELARRTPNTTLKFDYLGNYSQVNNVQSANNNRVNSYYDIRLNQDWFIRPAQFEYYQDNLANISYRLTLGFGAGYYIFDRTGLEWQISAGPSYQYTKFSTVETNQSDHATTPAAVLNSYFKADVTKRLTLIQSWQSGFTQPDAGKYSHHTVSTLEFEIKRHLNLDVSFIWDYLQNTEPKSDGVLPKNSDYYLTVGFGVRF